MQFKVPQDVQRADTIVGPLTWRQMFILAGGGGITYGIYVTLAKAYYAEVWLPPVIIVGGITAALAFLKVHGLSFEKYIMALIEYHFLPKKRIWKKGQAEPFVSFIQRKAEESVKKVVPTESTKTKKSFKELAEILDKGGAESLLPEDQSLLAEQMDKKKELEKIINHQK